MKNGKAYLVYLALGLLTTGCATPGGPELEEARAAFQRVENDPQVVSNAPVALERAGEALQAAEQAEDDEERQHLAYIAKQRALIARQETELAIARAQVEEAEVERQQVLLKARASEAERARLRAEQRAREAELARMQTEQAQARAAQLAAQIEELQAQQTERGLVLTLSDVLFAFDRAELKPGAMRTVGEISDFLQEYPERSILIEGFTDSIGSASYNQDLSQRRADAVRDALISMGVDPLRMQTRGYGEQFPVTSNSNEAGRQLNRRVEIIISDEEGDIPERSG